jgi:hypothetical protein
VPVADDDWFGLADEPPAAVLAPFEPVGPIVPVPPYGALGFVEVPLLPPVLPDAFGELMVVAGLLLVPAPDIPVPELPAVDPVFVGELAAPELEDDWPLEFDDELVPLPPLRW